MRRGVRYSVLAVLAGAFLCGCGEKIKPTVLPGIDSKSLPQQESWNSTVVLSDSGKVDAVIYAGYIRKYDAPRQTLLSQGVTVRFYNENEEQTSVLTSEEGKVDEATNNLEASGNVAVVSNDSTRLRTEKLYWDNGKQLIHTSEYVFITSPKENVQGKGFESDQQLRNYRIFRVTGEAKAQ
ncbi:MAG: LPS export ABC transporter periplasmic protein LptC [Ignavibacteria bacterium]|nr:LPS export ABC transporter periplasmic protein LptC [Ignavibacteria bacterium]